VHYFDPHEPQTEHASVPSFGTSLEDKYDHEVAATDLAFGRLVQGLEERFGTATAWIVTADHGEAFAGGHQFHGTDLFEDGIAVPLLLRAPGLAAGRVVAPASLVDLAPTLLALAQIDAPPGLDGQDLRSLDAERSVITDLLRVGDEGDPLLDQTAVTGSAQRLVRDHLKQVESLVRVGDRARPPLELDTARAAPGLYEALARYEESALAAADPIGAANLVQQ
jgi:arylsulfatase A-like enzyme